MNEHELALADYIVEMAKEYGEIETFVDSEVDWDLNDLDAVSLDRDTEDGEPVYVVSLKGAGTRSELVTRARYNPPGKAHPAEYKHHDIPLMGEIRFRPTKPMTTDEISAYVQHA